MKLNTEERGFLDTMRGIASSIGIAAESSANFVATTTKGLGQYSEALEVNGQTVKRIAENHNKISGIKQDIKLAETIKEAKEDFGDEYAEVFAKYT